jgi:hypothetical protein
MMKNIYKVFFLVTLFLLTIISSSLFAIDSELTRQTMTGLQGVNVMVEDLQPNMQKYARKFGLAQEQLKRDVEQKLQKSGIIILTQENWLKTLGRPVLYVNINTHEYEKYWYAYDIKVELKQIVYMEANPKVKTLASTWSISMTGIANIGTLNTIRDSLGSLVNRFIDAYLSANTKK